MIMRNLFLVTNDRSMAEKEVSVRSYNLKTLHAVVQQSSGRIDWFPLGR